MPQTASEAEAMNNELPCRKEEEEGVEGNSAEEHSDIVLQ